MRPLRLGRLRAVLSLGIAIGLGSAASAAADWHSALPLDAGTVAVGNLDVSVDGELVGTANIDGTVVRYDLELVELLPPERWAFPITATNSGTMPLELQAGIFGTGPLTPALAIRAWVDAVPANKIGTSNTAVEATTYRQTSTCSGGQMIRNWIEPSGAEAAPTWLDPGRVLLQPGESRTYCVLVAFSGAVALHTVPDYLNTKAGLTLIMRGTQVGAP
ncbi:MAG: hypothetical protein ACK5H2_10590 [Beutenbergiaceae bacterium]